MVSNYLGLTNCVEAVSFGNITERKTNCRTLTDDNMVNPALDTTLIIWCLRQDSEYPEPKKVRISIPAPDIRRFPINCL